MRSDKIADRIAGAIVDLAYKKANGGKKLCYEVHPKVAVEVLIGHNKCYIINETSEHLDDREVYDIVERITGKSFIGTVYNEVPQDPILAKNQETLHCGDNGIFKGVKTSDEERELTHYVQLIYDKYPFDGKFIIINNEIIACQSNCKELPIKTKAFNPLGYWTGGINVDSGATNRKLGSDMADSVTGGGLHGKDLSKADVSVNIHAFLKAQRTGETVQLCCAIGDDAVDGIPFGEIVEEAGQFIAAFGGFEKFAEWGLF